MRMIQEILVAEKPRRIRAVLQLERYNCDCRKKYRRENVQCSYSLTTNGTLSPD